MVLALLSLEYNRMVLKAMKPRRIEIGSGQQKIDGPKDKAQKAA